MKMRLLRYTVASILGLSLNNLLAEDVHWSYKGKDGPSHWAELKSEFETCKTGHQQSPINIVHPHKANLPKIKFDYHDSPLHVVNNGHTIQINYKEGSGITIGNEHYNLVQFHFHAPSEEEINGKHYDMVAHLVHKNDQGQLAVVAVLLKKGRENPALTPIWAHVPTQAGKAESFPDVTINVAQLLPRKGAYYKFEGSLTTPPCSEHVMWYVLKQPVELSAAQLKKFTKLYNHNNRPIQPLYGREILESS